ncbi:MAG TPA: helix-turn-helix domain-containing protein [Candidatus Acidoferrales bacterium]|nr:helix-turn-helix domain-containing protein [Candidatus Acidoferrales bacterium]
MPAQLKVRMKEPIHGDNCPVISAIKAIVTESRLLVVRHLFTGPKGFNELLRTSGINSKTLSATLKFLEEYGIVDRKIMSTRPFLVQYSLTTAGLELKPALEALGNWGAKWLPQLNPDGAKNEPSALAPKLQSR